MDPLIVIVLCFCCVVLLVVVGAALFILGIYNSLRTQNVLVDEAWSGIDVQLKKRYDLIPNLVETVKAYAKHESGIFEKVAELRSGMMNAKSPEELGQVEGELRSTLKTLFAVAENYPELKANENFLSLQGSLQQIESDLESARRYYNGAVRDLNAKIVVFPNSIIANSFGIKSRQFFEVTTPEERDAVKVNFQ